MSKKELTCWRVTEHDVIKARAYVHDIFVTAETLDQVAAEYPNAITITKMGAGRYLGTTEVFYGNPLPHEEESTPVAAPVSSPVLPSEILYPGTSGRR